MAKKSSNSVKLNKKEMIYANLGNSDFSKKNSKDPNSNNSMNAQSRLKNAQTREDKLAFQKLAFEESMNYKWDNFKYRKERDAKKDNDKITRAQERQKEYKQKRKEYIGKSISGALESWKFKF